MSSRFRIDLAAATALALALGACDHDEPSGDFAPTGPGAPAQRASALIPGGGALVTAPDKRALPYYGSSAAVTDGMQLYNQMNCVGCHFNGGGGIGPPLMDDQWVYGGRLDQIYDTIYFGRPHGMPAWGGKLTDDQIWKIATYVRSMSLPETLASNGDGTPSQHPAAVPKQADAFDGWHVPKESGD
jgi:cytochrome c oxidase cbb3-type subunit 3